MANNWWDWASGASAVFVAVQAAMKIYQRARIWLRPAKEQQHGITIMNGDARQLLEAVGRIESRQDRHGEALKLQSRLQQQQNELLAGHTKALDSLSQRTSTIEQRLSALS
jgi:hypothetical protein